MPAEQDARSDRQRSETSPTSTDQPRTTVRKTRERRKAAPGPSSPPPPPSREDDAAQAVHLICGKWGVRILAELARGVVRPGQLRRAIPGISRKMVTDTLRHLEARGLIVRLDLSDRVLHVQYRLREEMQAAASALLQALAEFGAAHRAQEGQGQNTPS